MTNDLIIYILLLLPGAFFSLVIHESVKAMCSTRLGDPTPKKKGFLSWNPLKYIEPIGFLCVLMFGFGWGQPVPTSPLYYKDRKKGVLITFITPSVVNLLTGIIASIVAGILRVTVLPMITEASTGTLVLSIASKALQIIDLFARCNVSLALFNILPVYPLDGAKVLQLFVSPNWAVKLTQYEKLLQLLLLALMAMGIIGRIINPITNLILRASW